MMTSAIIDSVYMGSFFGNTVRKNYSVTEIPPHTPFFRSQSSTHGDYYH